MAITLYKFAERLLDLYWQDYAPDDAFVTVEDFKFQIATAYSNYLNTFYQQERKSNKAETGFANIEIPPSWMIEEVISISYDKEHRRLSAQLKHPVYSFDWDNAVNTIQDIYGGCPDCKYRKVSGNEVKFVDLMPPISVILFTLNKPKEIVFWGAKEGYAPTIKYMPAIVGEDNDCHLSDNIANIIQPIVLETMDRARKGNFIQKLDDQNPNIIPQQQVNTSN